MCFELIFVLTVNKYYKLYGIDKYGTYILFISKSFFYRNFAS